MEDIASPLLKVGADSFGCIKERYCERRFKEYLMESEEEEQKKEVYQSQTDLDKLLLDENSDSEDECIKKPQLLSMAIKLKSQTFTIAKNNRFLLSKQEILNASSTQKFMLKNIAEISENAKDEEDTTSPTHTSCVDSSVIHSQVVEAADSQKLKNKRRRMQRKLRRLKVIDYLSDTNA
ncbi:unnamed protein product [Moneuplotes crassus]|uniref:Uncharacterized protein n=1 Tax=Euplotes crassus TaxID=5936 RepID=A0AAD2D3K8_EUPCR|nr:unnamed protein product [Moneuplotes crassus]